MKINEDDAQTIRHSFKDPAGRTCTLEGAGTFATTLENGLLGPCDGEEDSPNGPLPLHATQKKVEILQFGISIMGLNAALPLSLSLFLIALPQINKQWRIFEKKI